MAKGTPIAAMNIGAVAEDEFQDWYDTEHLPERQRVRLQPHFRGHLRLVLKRYVRGA